MLRRTTQATVTGLERVAVDGRAREIASGIVTDVRQGGEEALRRYALEYDRLDADAPLFFDRDALLTALEAIDPTTRGVLERTAARIEAFLEPHPGPRRGSCRLPR